MFLETFDHTLDENSRVAIPSKWRRNDTVDKGATLVITKGFDTNLMLFTQPDWAKYVEARVQELAVGEDNVRHFLRFFVSGASECVIDRSGRIMLPQGLIAYAKLTRDVVLNGSGFYGEIWDRVLWDRFLSENDEKLKSYAKEFFKIPIQGKGYDNGSQGSTHR